MESDRVQHFFWRYRDPAHPRHDELGNAIERIYEALDDALGVILAAAGPEMAVALVSDHGAGPLHTGVFLNAWLMEQGLLHLTQDFTQAFSRPSGSGGILLRRVLAKALAPVAPGTAASLRATARTDEQNRANNLLRSVIDWEKTLAWSDGMGGGIYCNPAAGEQRAALCKRLSAGLGELVDPRNGTKVIEAVHWREDIYHGPMVKAAPDLILTCAPGYQIFAPHEFLINAQTPRQDVFVDHPWSGRHESHGILVLSGPGTGGGDAGECAMVDVTPTLLALLGIPLPDCLDGFVLSRMLGGRVAAAHGAIPDPGAPGTPAPPSDAEAEAAMAAQLKSLGYM